MRYAETVGVSTSDLAPSTIVLSDFGSSSESSSVPPRLALERGSAIGRYIVVEALGRGGMGEVYLAYDPELDRRVALKLVRPRREEDGRQRLLREAQAQAQLSHPNVVTVYDVGTHGDHVFIAMEHVRGRTVQEWLDAERRSWREVVDVLAHAGRGLAAAHAAGLVHRDFKPTNVMVGEDGRVRVLDFGLARRFETGHSLHPEIPAAISSEHETSGSEGELTCAGFVMGTPAFMAPEQFRGADVDARTDQFAFCVVLFRAVHGVPPFTGKTFETLAKAVTGGNLVDPPRAKHVPRRIRRTIERGLARDPSERHPSMDALLRDLEGARRGGRRILVGVASTGLAGALAVGAGAMMAGPTPCADAGASMRDAWNDTTAASLRAAFVASGAAHAEETFTLVEPQLSAWADAWVDMRRDACEATQVRGEQSPALMDLRMACLDRKRHHLDAIVQVLESSDVEIVRNAVETAAKLPAIDECADIDRLRAAVPPVPAEHADEVEAVRQELALVRAQAHAGKFREGLEPGAELLARAQATGYLPLVAEAAHGLGHVQERNMLVEETRATYELALEAAAEAGSLDDEAHALVGLAAVSALHLDPDDSLRFARHAGALLRRSGDSPDSLGRLLIYRALAYSKKGEVEIAIEHCRRVIELDGVDPHSVLAASTNLASLLSGQGKQHEARDVLKDALARADALVGSHHPSYAKVQLNLGAVSFLLGEDEEARRHIEAAHAGLLAAFGPREPTVAQARQNLGSLLERQGKLDEALDHYLEALETKRALLGSDHASVAFGEHNVGSLLLRAGKPAEAIPHLEEARRISDAPAGTGAGNPVRAATLTTLANAYLASGRLDEAWGAVEEGLTLVGSDVDPVVGARIRFAAARVLRARGARPEEALEMARLAIEGYRASEQTADEELAEVEAWLAG
jgi:eukaryotic-like serine/threonine-protein kinase